MVTTLSVLMRELPKCCSWSKNQPVAYHGNSLGLPGLGISGEPPLAPFPVGDLGRVLTEHHPVETFSTSWNRVHASAPRILLATGSYRRSRVGRPFHIRRPSYDGAMPTKPPVIVHSDLPPEAPAKAEDVRLPSPCGFVTRSRRRNSLGGPVQRMTESVPASRASTAAAHRDGVTQDLDALRPVQDIDAEEHQRRGDAAVALFREIVRRATGDGGT